MQPGQDGSPVPPFLTTGQRATPPDVPGYTDYLASGSLAAGLGRLVGGTAACHGVG